MSFFLFRAAVAAVVTLLGVTGCAQPATEPAGAEPAPVTAPPTTTSPPPAAPSADDEPAPASPTPAASPTKKPAPKPSSTSSTCQQGERQREVEGYLAQLGGFGTVTVDGKQSAADCAAIKKFQQRYGVSPALGRAGPTTYTVARRLASTRTGDCRAGSGTTVCVNLTQQTVWVMRDGAVVLGPTVTRTGMAGFATPAGTFRINYRNIREWSNPYEVWMPYWQHFHNGMGFHETTSYLHDMSLGSHGCVNLLRADAVKLWSLAGVGTRVHLFGRRPGT